MSERAFQPDGEEHCDTKPDGGPEESFAKTNDVRASMKYPEVQSQKDDDTEKERDPVPGGDLDQGKHGYEQRFSSST